MKSVRVLALSFVVLQQFALAVKLQLQNSGRSVSQVQQPEIVHEYKLDDVATTIKVKKDEDSGGFKAFAELNPASDDFLTDDKVGSNCNAWAYLGGTQRAFSGDMSESYRYMSAGPTSSGTFNIEYHFCDTVRITHFFVGAVHHGHNVNSGVLQYLDEDGNWVAAAKGSSALQRSFWPSWTYASTYGWEIKNSEHGLGLSKRWRLYDYKANGHQYISGFDLSYQPIAMSTLTGLPYCTGQLTATSFACDALTEEGCSFACDALTEEECHAIHTKTKQTGIGLQCGWSIGECLAVGPTCGIVPS